MLPLVHLHHVHPTPPTQDGNPRLCPRACLLKGCEQTFQPNHHLDRYCSEACIQAARVWRRWVADQKYRKSESGKQHRKEQAKRYRERSKECQINMNEPRHPIDDSLKPEVDIHKPASVGDTKEKSKKKSCCQRPGCYERFTPPPQSPHKKYCGPDCYKAMRRVLVRESRWRKKLNLAPKKGRDGPNQPT